MKPAAHREAVGIKSRIHFNRYCLESMLEKGLVVRTDPEHPNLPHHRPHKPRAFGARLAVTLKYGIGESLTGLGFDVCTARVYARSGAGPADIGFYADAALRLAAFFGGFLFA